MIWVVWMVTGKNEKAVESGGGRVGLKRKEEEMEKKEGRKERSKEDKEKKAKARRG